MGSNWQESVRTIDTIEESISPKLKQQLQQQQDEIKKIQHWHRILDLIILISATIGCIYQTILVTAVYLEQQVITDIRIQFSEVVRIPDLSICLYFYNFVDYHRLKARAPKIFSRLKIQFPLVNNQSQFNEWKFSSDAITFLTIEFSRLTIKQMMEMMPDTEQLIAKVIPTLRQIDLVNNMNIDELNDCLVNTSVKEPYICMTINCPILSVRQLQQKDLELTKYLGTIVSIYFNHELFVTTEEYYVYLHPTGTLPYGNQMSSVTIVNEGSAHKFFIEYKGFEANLLPSPYTTNCKNYSQVGFKSQAHALETCRNNVSLERFGCGFYSDVMPTGSNAKLATSDYYLNYDDPKRRKLINEIYDNCSKIYPEPDCKQKYFVPRIQKVARIDSSFTIICLSFPTEPDITNTCLPKLPLFEYLIYIGSILGTWFGFSILDSAPMIFKGLFDFCRVLTSSKPAKGHILRNESNSNSTRQAKFRERRSSSASWRKFRTSMKSVKKIRPHVESQVFSLDRNDYMRR
ncbi:uncharacterized protein LOC128396675 [Panonychus citri]|uniref:uncharacterized protein LOC128396675 n=1 Tax=Panonychus citri TaxID=50023 RepID=UPI002307A313|nr:uncharacterized protein LOC128396675 [Panonychus citri]